MAPDADDMGIPRPRSSSQTRGDRDENAHCAQFCLFSSPGSNKDVASDQCRRAKEGRRSVPSSPSFPIRPVAKKSWERIAHTVPPPKMKSTEDEHRKLDGGIFLDGIMGSAAIWRCQNDRGASVSKAPRRSFVAPRNCPTNDRLLCSPRLWFSISSCSRPSLLYLLVYFLVLAFLGFPAHAWVVVNNEGRITFLGGLDIDPTRAGMVASLQFKKRGKSKWELSYDDIGDKSVLFVKNKFGEKVQQYNEDGKIDYFGKWFFGVLVGFSFFRSLSN